MIRSGPRCEPPDRASNKAGWVSGGVTAEPCRTAEEPTWGLAGRRGWRVAFAPLDGGGLSNFMLV